MNSDLNSLQQQNLFDKFLLQLHKDFEMAGLIMFAPTITSNNLEHIKDEILNSVLRIEKSSYDIQTLLYRIDITEKQIKQALTTDTQQNFHQTITELIIKRILQKIILKQHYSS